MECDARTVKKRRKISWIFKNVLSKKDNRVDKQSWRNAWNCIYLNDKYVFDAPSANGYVGILWAMGALHDRAFPDYPVTGKFRRMTYNSVKRKNRDY